MTQAISAIRRKPISTILGLLLVVAFGTVCFFAQQNIYAGCNSPDGTRIDLTVDFSADPDEAVIVVDTTVTYSAAVTSNTTRHVYEWEIKDSTGNTVKEGSGSALIYTYTDSGEYTVDVTVWALPYTDPDTGTTDSPNSCRVDHQFEVTVVEIVEILVKPQHNPDALDWGSTAEIAVGAVASNPHKADVKVRISPVPSGSYSVDVPVELVNGEGYNGSNNAVLDILSSGGTITFDSSDGIEYGVLTSSDVMRGVVEDLDPCEIKASVSAYVSFAPFDDAVWTIDPPWIIPDGTSDHELVFTWKGAPLDNHDIRLFVEEVTYEDSYGSEQVITNTALNPDPAAVAPYATFTPDQIDTDSSGTIASSLWTADISASGDEWKSILLVAYDYSARNTPGVAFSPAPSFAASSAYTASPSSTDQRRTAKSYNQSGLPPKIWYTVIRRPC